MQDNQDTETRTDEVQTEYERIQKRNLGGGEIFGTWGPPSLLYNGHRVFYPRVKQLGCSVNHPPLSRAEVKERVET